MNEFLANLLRAAGLAWWVEITTDNPQCVYYFGPFLSQKESQAHQAGYIEDLEKEGATNIKVQVKRCKPSKLTIYDEKADSKSTPMSGVLSSQF